MTKNSVKYEGAFTADTKKTINDNLLDIGYCSAQFLVDSGSTGTTLTNVTGMVTETLAPGTYRFEINLITTATANSGLKFGLKFGTASMLTSIAAKTYAYTASAIATSTFTTATDAAAMVAATAAYTGARVVGTVVVAKAGTLQLQAAQNASHADDTTVEVGSFMMFQKIA
jgi:hypothetical protein